MSYERNRERKALERKRSASLPHIPDFLLKLTRGFVEDIWRKSERAPSSEEVERFLDNVCEDREKAQEILSYLKKEHRLVYPQTQRGQMLMFPAKNSDQELEGDKKIDIV